MKRSSLKIWMIVVFTVVSAGLSAVNPSGTLPIVHITTNTGQPVTDRDNYVTGTIYIDNCAAGQTLGTAASPKTMSIRGRGNYTWTGFEKKPYKIKLDTSSTVLGMLSSKHWALMAAADDNLGFMRNTLGFMLSKHIGLRWTPSQVPVELIINNEYLGLYFLTETVRIQKNRINIASQPDQNQDPLTMSGGWLVEIDNYDADNQAYLREKNNHSMRVTVHTPEIMSSQQQDYISAQMNLLNDAFYESTSEHWEQLVDLDELVKFYLVQEIIENCESYHGSCYFYRDEGADAKWFWGPVWDFGNSYWRHQELPIYENPTFYQYWIGQIASFPSFQSRLQEFWYDFLNLHYQPLLEDLKAFKDQIKTAAKRDADRWDNHGSVCTNRDMEGKYSQMTGNLTWRINYLRSAWGNGVQAIHNMPEEQTAVKMFRNGQVVIVRDGTTYSVTGMRLDN